MARVLLKDGFEKMTLKQNEIRTENALNMLQVLWDRIYDLCEENRRLRALVVKTGKKGTRK